MVAYNRDDAEVFEISRALEAGCDDMYSTAPDVLEKKMKSLDRKIEEEARQKAQNIVTEVQDEKRAELIRKEKSMDELIDDLAMSIIEQNRSYIGDEVAEESKKRVKKTSKKEGGSTNDRKKTGKKQA